MRVCEFDSSVNWFRGSHVSVESFYQSDPFSFLPTISRTERAGQVPGQLSIPLDWCPIQCVPSLVIMTLLFFGFFFLSATREKKWDLYPASFPSASTSASMDISGMAFHSSAATHGDFRRINRQRKQSKQSKSDFSLHAEVWITLNFFFFYIDGRKKTGAVGMKVNNVHEICEEK